MKKLLLISLFTTPAIFSSEYLNAPIEAIKNIQLPTVNAVKQTVCGAISSGVSPLTNFAYENMILAGVATTVIATTAYKVGQYSKLIHIDPTKKHANEQKNTKKIEITIKKTNKDGSNQKSRQSEHERKPKKVKHSEY